MKFSSKEDIEAPIEDVFALLSEFETYERSAIRRGIDVQRMTDISTPRAGITWHVQFNLRGKKRELDLVMAEYDRPNTMRIDARSTGLDGYMSLDLLALSQKRTRMAVALELKPKTLSARLLVQSFKLAKSNLTKRFKLRVAEFAKGMEDRISRTA